MKMMIRKKEEWVEGVELKGKKWHKFTKIIYFLGIPVNGYIHFSSTKESLDLYSGEHNVDSKKNIGFGINKKE